MKRIYKNLFRNSLIQKLLGLVLFLYLNLVYYTSRRKYIYPENFEVYKQNRGCIMMFWHNRAALIPFLATRGRVYNALISNHSDGILLQNTFKLFKVGIISGSTNRAATSALRNTIKAIQNNETVSTGIDGPRGPRYQINSNLAVVAQKNDVPVLPVSYNCKRKVTLSSWDKMIIPLPFNNIVFHYGELLIFPKSGKKEAKELNGIIKKAIDSISDKAKDF